MGNPLNLCECGCGQATSPVRKADTRRNRKVGDFPRFIQGHQYLRHGFARHSAINPTWHSWSAMKSRCTKHQWYKARGIEVCERWLTFENFLADMGVKPPGTSLDRIDNDGNYEPRNCRWATRKEQENNTTRNRWIVFNGERKTLAQWAEATGIGRQTIAQRLLDGWTVERALTTTGDARKGGTL